MVLWLPAVLAAASFAASFALAAPSLTVGPEGAPTAAAPTPGAPVAVASTSSAAALASRPGAPLPRVTEIRIDKSEHTLELVAGGEVVRSYRVAIGPGGPGPKRHEGDLRTPVGTYRVAGRIKGLFHQFLIVSYPNEEDRRRFAELKRRGEVPPGRGIGHSIGIHGVGGGALRARAGAHKETDWTLGCIALDDDEIDEVARRTPDGAKIVITD
ncbi:L,D-transpeptidase family protein [Sorangium sp. So ce1335]|uniref:L,D-transpeptidase family protein n=1 Tax=Sorangium sp. So ce1335 TaxID=3133335 RepID=UPI003F611B44